MEFGTKKSTTDFRVLFFLGITFVGAGVAIGLYALSGLGLILMLIGLLNRDKWPTQQPRH